MTLHDASGEELVEGPHPVLLEQLVGMEETDGESEITLHWTRLEGGREESG